MLYEFSWMSDAQLNDTINFARSNYDALINSGLQGPEHPYVLSDWLEEHGIPRLEEVNPNLRDSSSSEHFMNTLNALESVLINLYIEASNRDLVETFYDGERVQINYLNDVGEIIGNDSLPKRRLYWQDDSGEFVGHLDFRELGYVGNQPLIFIDDEYFEEPYEGQVLLVDEDYVLFDGQDWQIPISSHDAVHLGTDLVEGILFVTKSTGIYKYCFYDYEELWHTGIVIEDVADGIHDLATNEHIYLVETFINQETLINWALESTGWDEEILVHNYQNENGIIGFLPTSFGSRTTQIYDADEELIQGALFESTELPIFDFCRSLFRNIIPVDMNDVKYQLVLVALERAGNILDAEFWYDQ